MKDNRELRRFNPLLPDFHDLSDWNAQKFIKHSIATSEAIQREDIEVCESVQRGYNSMSFETGRYSSKLETAVHHFHKLLWSEMTGRGF